MYCKGITKNGTPCCRQVSNKSNSKYCHSHKPPNGKKYSECGICYGDAQIEVDLSCGHSFCLPCLQKWHKFSCPMCRKNTNHRVCIDVSSKMCTLSKNMEDMHKVSGKPNKIKCAQQIFDLTMSMHSFLLHHKPFLENFENKVKEFTANGMDTSLYRKQLESFYSRNTVE